MDKHQLSVRTSALQRLFNKYHVRIGVYTRPDGSKSPAVSVHDMFAKVFHMSSGHARRTWSREQVALNYVAPRDYQMYNFPKKKGTPVVTIEVAIEIIDNLSNPKAKAFRRANPGIFRNCGNASETRYPNGLVSVDQVTHHQVEFMEDDDSVTQEQHVRLLDEFGDQPGFYVARVCQSSDTLVEHQLSVRTSALQRLFNKYHVRIGVYTRPDGSKSPAVSVHDMFAKVFHMSSGHAVGRGRGSK
ncbi:hypothetical protein HDU81_008595 [Chytriomyces hyalinus]|nr:hypothetical protein HDU81_008595 [Chytriomyces hyalinus]